MLRITLSALAVVLTLLPSPSLAQDLAAGLMAARNGDFEAALKEWKPLAEQGDVDAQFNLGQMYANGLAVSQDDTQAAAWYRKAADQGDVTAQSNLGLMYSKGSDSVAAHMWFYISGANGSDVGLENRTNIEGTMTPSEISEAQRRARLCVETNYQDCG